MAKNISISLDFENILKWALLSLAFVPLIASSSLFFPYVFGKTVFIRLVITLFWILFSLYLLGKRRREETSSIKSRLGFLKDPLFIAVSAYLFLAALSTIFAAVPFRSFFGTVERGGGFITLLFLTSLLPATLLLFKDTDWLKFFKLTLVVGSIIATDAIIWFLRFGSRPNGTFIGNPTFIAVYLIFVLFAAFLVLGRARGQFWRYASYLAILLSVAAIAVANTRGVIVGLIAGVIAVAVYFVLRGSGNTISIFGRGITLRKLGIIALVLITLFSVFFSMTINSLFWDRVPGVNRLTEISLEDNTVKSRLATIGISLSAVDPTENGLHRLLFGWGLDNFNIAYNKYYDPSIQKYDARWFDRAHNQILDVLVMTGVLGLIAYLAIWYYIFRFPFRGTRVFSKIGSGNVSVNMIGASVTFFAVAYFVQNLFSFEQATTYVPLFVFIAFIIHLRRRGESRSLANSKRLDRALAYTPPILAILFTTFLVLYTLIPLYQSMRFVQALRTEDAVMLYNTLDAITEPYNYAQSEIRFRVISAASTLIGIEQARPIVDEALRLQEEILEKEFLEPRYFQVAGFIHYTSARAYNEPEGYPRAEELFRRAVDLAPGRQELMSLLAQSISSQGRFEEANLIIEEMLNVESESIQGQFYYVSHLAPQDWDDSYNTTELMDILFRQRVLVLDGAKVTQMRNSYNNYLQHYFQVKDEEGFLNTMERAIEIEGFMLNAREAQGFDTSTQEEKILELQIGINAFRSVGWDAISVGVE